MKRLIVLVMVLGLLLAGCATMQKVGEDVGVVAEKVCNFDAATSQEATEAIAFISTAAAVVGPLVGVPVTSGQAMATLNTVETAAQTGACVLLIDLQNALAFFNQLAVTYKAQSTAKGKAMISIPSTLNLRIKARM